MSYFYNHYIENKNDYNSLKRVLDGGGRDNRNKWKHEKNSNSGLRISIQNHTETPWLDWIEQGVKKYEGRLNRGIFEKLKINDLVTFFDRSGKEIKIKVIELKYYDDFVEAFKDLGSELIPIKNIDQEGVKQLYNKYFSDHDIKMNGVVAIGVEVQSHR